MYVHERDNICSIVLEKNSKNENIKVRSEYVDSSSKPNMETFIGFIPTIQVFCFTYLSGQPTIGGVELCTVNSLFYSKTSNFFQCFIGFHVITSL